MCTRVCAVACLGRWTFSCSSVPAACVALVTPADSPESLTDFWPKCMRTDFSTGVEEMGPCHAHESCSGVGGGGCSVRPPAPRLGCAQRLLPAPRAGESRGLSCSALPHVLVLDCGKQLRCCFPERNVRNPGCCDSEEHLRREMREVFPQAAVQQRRAWFVLGYVVGRTQRGRM